MTFQASCAPILPPDVLGDVDRASRAPAVTAASKDAPAALAEAERLRRAARAAFEAGDLAGAQILGEEALAAYQVAVALARAARAERARVAAASQEREHQSAIAKLDAEHQRVAADIAALERRVRTLREVEPIQASGEATPAREQARREAVASIRLQAALLCQAATLLSRSQAAAPGHQDPKELAEGVAALAKLDATLASEPAATPIDGATRARASCLRALTMVRRAGKAGGAGPDALLEELSKAGYSGVRRDESGVVVTLRGLFDKDRLAPEAKKQLLALAKISQAHPGYPVLVVLHHRNESEAASNWNARGAAVVAALESVIGKDKIGKPVMARGAQPVVDPKSNQAHQNERVEVVFVSPRAL